MLSVAIQTDVSITAIEVDSSIDAVLSSIRNAMGGLFVPGTTRREDARFDLNNAGVLNARLVQMMTVLTRRSDRVEVSVDADKSLGLDLLVVIKPAENTLYAVRTDPNGRPCLWQEWDFGEFMYRGDYNDGWLTCA